MTLSNPLVAAALVVASPALLAAGVWLVEGVARVADRWRREERGG